MSDHDPINHNPVIVALDFPDARSAVTMAKRLAPHVGGFKVGLELLMGPGPAAATATEPSSTARLPVHPTRRHPMRVTLLLLLPLLLPDSLCVPAATTTTVTESLSSPAHNVGS